MQTVRAGFPGSPRWEEREEMAARNYHPGELFRRYHLPTWWTYLAASGDNAPFVGRQQNKSPRHSKAAASETIEENLTSRQNVSLVRSNNYPALMSCM